MEDDKQVDVVPFLGQIELGCFAEVCTVLGFYLHHKNVFDLFPFLAGVH